MNKTLSRMDDETGVTSGLLVVISAPSGGGKTTLCRLALEADPRLSRALTCTTRAPRPGERDGMDYHFMSTPEFERRITAGDFLEHAEVHGNRYGTLRDEVLAALRSKRDVLLNVDVQGAATLRRCAVADRELDRALVTVFLTPPTPEILEQRLRGRGTESRSSLDRRLTTARAEIARWREFDYLLLSDSAAQDVKRLLAILEVERLRAKRQAPPWGGAT